MLCHVREGLLVLGLGGSLCNYSCPWYRVHKNHKRADNTPQIMLLLHMQIRRYFNKICDKMQ